MSSSMNKKTEAWTNSCLASIKASHRALSYLYDGLDTDYCANEDGLSLPPTPMENVSITEMARTFTQHCQDLALRLSSPTKGQVRLPVGAVLKLVSRCLAVTFSDVIPVPSLKDLSAVLPNLHGSALDLLAYLILCCGSNLLPKSKLILDICLQTLLSTEKMEEPVKSESRANVYRVLSLWLEMAGLGRYYLSKVKDVHRELISDIAMEEKSFQTQNGGVTSHVPDTNKKGKGKKKGSRKVESYLDSDFANAASKESGSICPQRVASTLGALQVSRLVAERGQFGPMQGLMRGVVDVASAIQRDPPTGTSPYADPECRESLYHTLFSFSTVSIRSHSSSADTVLHFQLTCRALSLVLHGGFSDPSVEVATKCQNWINSSKSLGSLNRPIVRKVLPEEQTDSRDVMEMDRQMEQLRDENERVKRKLVEAEVEKQKQSRLISQMTEEMEMLKSKVRQDKMRSLSAQPSNADETNGEGTSLPDDEDSDMDEEEEEDSMIEERKKEEEVEEEVIKEDAKKHDNVSGRSSSAKSEQDSTVAQGEGQSEMDIGKKKKEKKKYKKHKGGVSSQPERPTAHASTSPDVLSASTAHKKRNLSEVTESSSHEKKSRLEETDEAQSADVTAMLMDFVDADADSD